MPRPKTKQAKPADTDIDDQTSEPAEDDDDGGEADAIIQRMTVDPRDLTDDDRRERTRKYAPSTRKKPAKAKADDGDGGDDGDDGDEEGAEEIRLDSAIGWRFLYEVSYPSGERTPEHTLSDCFDVAIAMREIAQYHGACRGHFRVLAPYGTRVQPNHLPRTRDEDGRVRQCDRRGTFTVPPTFVLKEFGYWHVPLADKNNLLHREVAPPDVVAAAQYSSGRPDGTGKRDDDDAGDRREAPMNRASFMQMEEIKRQMAELTSASAHKEDFGTVMERMKMSDELRRQQRRIETEEEEQVERKARERKRSEREEEEESRRLRWAEDDRRRKAEAEIDRERRREEFEHQLRISREEHQARREEARLEMERDKARSGEGGPIGQMLINALMGRLENSMGDGSIIDKLFGSGGGEEDGSILGQLSKATGMVEKLVGLSKMVPQAAQAQPQIAAPQAARQTLPTGAPAQQATQPGQAQMPPPITDSPEFPAIQGEDGTVVVKTPQGYGVRTPQGLFPVDSKFHAELDQAFAAQESDDSGDDEEDFEDEMQEMAFGRLRKKAPALESVVHALLDGLRPMAKISKFDVDLLTASCSSALEELEGDELLAAKTAVQELNPDEFAENLPWFAESGQRANLKTEAAQSALRETLERIKAETKTG